MKNNFILLGLAALAGFLIYQRSRRATTPITTVPEPLMPLTPQQAVNATNPNVFTSGSGSTSEPGGGRRGML